MRIIVYHGGYGCDTGCCGHIVGILPDGDDVDHWDASREHFEFTHPYDSDGEDHIAFARRLVEETMGAEHCKDLDWEHCHIVDGMSC